MVLLSSSFSRCVAWCGRASESRDDFGALWRDARYFRRFVAGPGQI
jgi:hypothetical protein